MAPPRIYVDPAPVTPSKFGLASVAIPGTTPDHWETGVHYQSNACAIPHLWPDPCGPTPPQLTRTISVTLTTVPADPNTDPATITAAAATSGGPARTISVKVGAAAPVIITTGLAAVPVAVVPVNATYPVVLIDTETEVTDTTGEIVINATGVAPVEFVQFNVIDLTSKTFEEGQPLTIGTPFTVYTGFECKAVDLDEARRVAAERLALVEWRGVEQALWENLPPADPNFPDNLGLVVLDPAPSLCAGFGALEEFLGANYAGVGIIHAPRRVASYVDTMVHQEQAQLKTLLGTLVAFGGGYDPLEGPTGQTAPTEGQSVWMYATGAIVYRRSAEPFVNPPDGGALDRVTNQVTVAAERTYVLTVECVIAAVLVTLEDPPA